MNRPTSSSPRRWPLAVLALALLGGLLWWQRDRDSETSAVPDELTMNPASQAALAGPRDRPTPVLDLRATQRAIVTGTITDKQGRPIAGAQVCASTENDELPTSDRRRASCVQAGRDGHYRIEGLFPVRYTVAASAAGHIPAPYQHGEGAARRFHVQLRAAQEARGIDITLEGGGVEIHGNVKDLSGGAVEGAQVWAGGGFALSDAEGHFSAWVRPGSLYLTVQADGYADGSEQGAAPGHLFEVYLTPESVLIGKVVRASDGSPVEGAHVNAAPYRWSSSAISDANGNFRIDGLHPGPYKPRAESDDAVGLAAEQTILGLGETSTTITISVHPAFFVEGAVVVAGGGDGCDDGAVRLADRTNGRNGYAPLEGEVVRIRGLLPGTYEVTAGCTGFVSEERYPDIVITDHSVTGQRWQVSHGQSIRGVVVDAGGKPIARASVSVAPKSDPSQPRAHQTGSWSGDTDDDGRFTAAGLLPGRYGLTVSAWSPRRAGPRKPIEVTLPKGEDLDDVKLELPATGEVKGTVRDAKGNPLPKIVLRITDGVQDENISAADDGSFHFPFLAAGEYRLTAVRGFNDRLRAPGTSDDDVQGEKVRVRAGAVEHVKLVVESRSSVLSGVVRDADGGPVADAFVDVTRESDSASKAAGGAMREGRWGSFGSTPHLTDQDGRFRIEDLADDKHTVRAHRKGGGEAVAEHVEPGTDVVLTIAGTGRMAGTIVAPGGVVPEDFTVSLHDEATGFRRSDNFFRTGGVWSIPELPAGKYKIRVSAGPGVAEIEASMTAGQDTTGVRVELTPKVTVRGTVVDLEGKPVAGMTVLITNGGAWSSGDHNKNNVTDADGRYELAGC